MNDKVMGYVIVLGSLFGIACYFYLLFVSPWALLVLQVSAFVAVAAVLTIIAWIGYTLATTPPMEELDIDFEDFDREEKET